MGNLVSFNHYYGMNKIPLDHFLQRNGMKHMPNPLSISQLRSCKYISPKCNLDYSNYHRFPCTVYTHVCVSKNVCLSVFNKTQLFCDLTLEDESLGRKGDIINQSSTSQSESSLFRIFTVQFLVLQHKGTQEYFTFTSRYDIHLYPNSTPSSILLSAGSL